MRLKFCSEPRKKAIIVVQPRMQLIKQLVWGGRWGEKQMRREASKLRLWLEMIFPRWWFWGWSKKQGRRRSSVPAEAVKRGKRGGDRCVLPPATSAPSLSSVGCTIGYCVFVLCVFVYLCIYIFVYLCCVYFELVHPPPPNCKSCTIAVTVSIRARCHNYTNNVPSRYLSSILTKSVSERVRRGQVRYRHSIVVDVCEVRFSHWLESHS